MAENQFPSTVDALFKGMDHFITSKTVVGEPVKVDENTTIIPLVDVTCGMGSRFLCPVRKDKWRRRYEREDEPQRHPRDPERHEQSS